MLTDIENRNLSFYNITQQGGSKRKLNHFFLSAITKSRICHAQIVAYGLNLHNERQIPVFPGLAVMVHLFNPNPRHLFFAIESVARQKLPLPLQLQNQVSVPKNMLPALPACTG